MRGLLYGAGASPIALLTVARILERVASNSPTSTFSTNSSDRTATLSPVVSGILL